MISRSLKQFCRASLALTAIYGFSALAPGALASSALLPISSAMAAPVKAAGYDQPEKLVTATVDAIRAHDRHALQRLFGSAMPMLTYVEQEIDNEGIARFLAAFDQSHQLTHIDEQTQHLLVGQDEWIFPFPLIKKNGLWRYDIQAGKQEMINRGIGRNELAAIGACHAYIDAQHEYFQMNPDKNSVPTYAQKLFSSPGKHDGLYWEASPGGMQSPLGVWFAKAHHDGTLQQHQVSHPYHGYFFKALTAQGPGAAGGTKGYIKDGKMTQGFALLAWPARYNVTGLTTIMCNQDGAVFSKNLGPDTEMIANNMVLFNPDKTWTAE